MKKSFINSTIILALSIGAIYGFSSYGERDPNSKPSSYNNPIISGPVSDNPVIPLFESFEFITFPPAGWTKFSPDAGTGWTRVTAGTSPLPGWNGGIVTTPPGGLTAAAYCTWNTGGPVNNDQWLVTPQITNVGFEDSLTFWVQCPGFSNIQFGDSLLIMVSTTTSAIQSFSRATVLSWDAGSSDTNWSRKAFSLTNFPGVSAGSSIYIAFRELASDNTTSGAALLLDLVEVSQSLTALENTSTNLPEKYALSQNFPNPFNPSTKINFNIAKKSFVSLNVYDMLGRKVADLVGKELHAGSYSYDFDASELNSGIYFYTLKTEQNSITKKMMLIK